MKSRIKKKVLIIGAGFAGVSVIKELFKKAPEDFEIVLIDKNDYQLFYPALFRALVSSKEISEVFEGAAIKFNDIFDCNDIEIHKIEVAEIDSDINIVKAKGKGLVSKSFSYDYLVVAPGTETNPAFLNFKSFEDMVSIRTRLETVFKFKAKGEPINITVVGGGLTGCELMAVLVGYVNKLADKYGHPRSSLKFKIIEGGSEILSSLGGWERENTQKILEQMGVEILLNTLADENHQREADVFIMAAGGRPGELVEKLGEPTARLNLQAHENIFVVKAPTAQSAIRQGKHIANALIKKIKNKRVPSFKDKKSYYIVELGGDNVFLDLGLIKLKGAAAKWAHEYAFLRYLSDILGRTKARGWFEKYKAL